MSQSLNVIALVSGGKDSIYSILHCLQNSHKIVALGNIYPPAWDDSKSKESHVTQEVEVDEDDLNSYMYQTVGHTVIPLYEQALGIPLYRQPILGKAVDMDSTYGQPTHGVDETESLVPLLQKIMAAHPEANAVSTGAILSTYQRTRVESVAVRLGLQPLSFLWQYPFLHPNSQISLLMDMNAIGLDARIIKVASMGLDESLLWQNVASKKVIRKLERIMTPYTTEEDGAVLGEGGQYETLVVDGPDHLFKGRIVVDEEDTQIVVAGGGAAWLRIKRARVEMKVQNSEESESRVRIPDLFSHNFDEAPFWAHLEVEKNEISPPDGQIMEHVDETWDLMSTQIGLKSMMEGQTWIVVGRMQPHNTIEEEAEQIMAQIKGSFHSKDMDVTDVISALILLRSMSHFAVVNKIYGSVFTKPNPPARVTVACGDVLPPGNNIIIHLNLFSEQIWKHGRRGLHVQSRSYWAPANIGPYSQAKSLSLSTRQADNSALFLVHIAGQIPLVPSTMALHTNPEVPMHLEDSGLCQKLITHEYSNFITQTALSLQHLWRIGNATDVISWTAAVAYLSKDSHSKIAIKAKLAGRAWEYAHRGEYSEDQDSTQSELIDGDRDLWEERYNRGYVHKEFKKNTAKMLPDWSIISGDTWFAPPFFAAEVEELPRGSDIEWHALLGVTKGPVVQTGPFGYKFDNAYKSVINMQFSQTIVFIKYAPEINDLSGSIDSLLSQSDTLEESRCRNRSDGYHHAHAAYLDACVKGLWGADSYAGVVPCRSLWDGQGNRLAAVLVFRSFLEPGEVPANDSN